MAEQSDGDVRQGAKAAAAAAAVGAAVGVARALAARTDATARRNGDESEAREEEHDDVQETVEAEPRESEPDGETEREEEPTQSSIDRSDLRRLTDQARAILEDLSGADIESVSALERTQNGWRVTLEGVELRRIPESTDVLATYEVELDRDGELVRYERRRRYSRAQSDREGGT